MDFRIDAVLPATAEQLWAIFFDVQRVATLIPGCESVTEVEPLRAFAAVMKQKIGPFKLEVPTRIDVESQTPRKQVVIVAAGADRFTGTTIDVRMAVELDELAAGNDPQCRLGVAAGMQVAGRLASLGYPIVRKRSEELFAEFERRLRQELSGVGSPVVASAPVRESQPAEPKPVSVEPAQPEPTRAPRPLPQAVQLPPATGARPSRVELVLVWPRVGVTVLAGVAVAHAAAALGQASWWWLAAPLLGVAAGLGRRQD